MTGPALESQMTALPQNRTPDVRCGQSDPNWREYYPVGRESSFGDGDDFCILPANHDGPHFSHRISVGASHPEVQECKK
jgi:hypothetical protein